MMDKNQKLQLKVLLKTRIRQLNTQLQQSLVKNDDVDDKKMEVLALRSNLKNLEDGGIGPCKQCGKNIDYLYLIASPHTEFCEKCGC